MIGRAASAAVRSWNRWWFRPTSAYPLAAFRILFAVYLLGYFGIYAPHVEIMYSSLGVYTPYAVPDYAPPPVAAWMIYALLFMVIVAFGLGYRTRWTAPLVLLLYLYHYFLGIAEKHSSFDRLNIVFLIVLCFAESGRVWSLDARRAPAASAQVSIWPSRVILLQLVFLYTGSGLWKVINPAWENPEAMKNPFHSMWGTPLGFWTVATLPDWAWRIITPGVIVFEILLGLAFLWRRTRPLAILGGTGFHLSTWAFMSIPDFMSCAITYVLFVPARYVRPVGEWVAARVSAPRSARAPASRSVSAPESPASPGS